MAWFEYETSRIYYEEEGEGVPLLLLPGWGGSIEHFAPLRQALAKDHRVIAADLPGSGRSGPQPRQYMPSYLHDDAAAFVALIERHLGPAFLAGFSDGGEVSLLIAEQRPDLVRGLVTWGASAKLQAPPGMLEAFGNLIDAPIPPLEAFSVYMKQAYGEDNARVMVRNGAAAIEAIVAAGGDVSWSRAGEIRCPSLLITGEHDFLATPALVEELATRIPSAEFRLAEGAGHDVYADQPEWLGETLLGWLAELGQSAPVQR